MNSDNSDREALVENDSQNDEHVTSELSVQNAQIPRTLGFWAVIFLTVNATLGAGMLNIPYAFLSSGNFYLCSLIHFVSFVCDFLFEIDNFSYLISRFI